MGISPALMSFHIPPLWRVCLPSAYRTALACAIVGCVTYYSPSPLQSLLTFPACAYFSLIVIIINDATLGDTLRGCWLALIATIQSIGPAMLVLWAVGPTRFSKVTISLVVALAAFVVVLPSDQSTPLIAKRLSLGHIVVVYIVGYAEGDRTYPLMQPVRLAASTALAAIACVLALLIPYPRLAINEVNENYKLLADNILKRLKLLVKAICEDDKNSALALVSHAKSMVTTPTKLLQAITRYQDAIQWERPLLKVFKRHCLSPRERLQQVDTNLRGMELALSCIKSFPVNILDEDLKHGLNRLEEHVSLAIKHTEPNLHEGSLAVPESSAENLTHFLQSLHAIPITHKDLPTYFFLFCAKLLDKTSSAETLKPAQKNGNLPESEEKWANWAATFRSTNLVPAIKFSLSLGLAVFMGLIYSVDNGFWAGLPLALSYVSGREAIFRAVNVKAQGTALGSVFGVLGYFVFERSLPLRLLSLLPWFIFSNFLQRSRMYGPAGGTTAAIGVLLILGRKNFGPASVFAIARTVETFIGLSCSIFVYLIFMPQRASKCAKVFLSKSLASLGKSIGPLSLLSDANQNELEDNQRRLKTEIDELKKFVVEAEAEPNFWFLPFYNACYNKLLGSLSRLVDLLHFGAHALKFLQQELKQDEACGKEDVNMLQGELQHMKELICSSIQCLEEISRMESLSFLDTQLEKRTISSDLESGKSTKCNTWMLSSLGEVGIDITIGSFLQRSRNVVDNLYGGEGANEWKSQVVLSLGTLGFSLKAFMRETIEIEEAIKELVQRENPTSEINLYEISCKLHALNK